MKTTRDWMGWLLMTFLLAGCGGTDNQDTGHSTADAAARWTIGLSQGAIENAFDRCVRDEVVAAAGQHADVELLAEDAGDDATLQQRQVRDMITAGVDLIIICPAEAVALTAPVGEAIDAGIPVIVLDRPVVGDKYTCLIDVDNRALGEAAGRWLVDRLDGTGNLVELQGLMTDTAAIRRHEGFRDAIVDADFDILFHADTRWLEADARKAMQSALEQYDNIDAVFAHSDTIAQGACLAAEQAGRREDMLVVGVGGLPGEGRRYVEQRRIDASFEYPTGGREAVDVALRILRGAEPQKNIVLPFRFYTRENVEHGGELVNHAAAADVQNLASGETGRDR